MPTPPGPARSSLAVITEVGQANAFGTLHGGVLLRLADDCGAIAAMRHAGGRVATAAFDALTFLGPVFVGERVEICAEVTHAGRTSVETRIEIFAEPLDRADRRKVAVGYALFVALDPSGRPRPVPPLPALTDDDRRRERAAHARQAVRLARRAEALGGGPEG